MLTRILCFVGFGIVALHAEVPYRIVQRCHYPDPTWRAIQITKPNPTHSEIIALARKLHKEHPAWRYEFFNSSAPAAGVIRHVFLIHRGDLATPADDKFDYRHYLGMLNPIGIGPLKFQWQLMLDTAPAEIVPMEKRSAMAYEWSRYIWARCAPLLGKPVAELLFPFLRPLFTPISSQQHPLLKIRGHIPFNRQSLVAAALFEV